MFSCVGTCVDVSCFNEGVVSLLQITNGLTEPKELKDIIKADPQLRLLQKVFKLRMYVRTCSYTYIQNSRCYPLNWESCTVCRYLHTVVKPLSSH